MLFLFGDFFMASYGSKGGKRDGAKLKSVDGTMGEVNGNGHSATNGNGHTNGASNGHSAANGHGAATTGNGYGNGMHAAPNGKKSA